ncbi:hypothetical protein D3C81_2099230 [compost metagenome]|nr:hypothetical protein [Pseudomonas putida]
MTTLEAMCATARAKEKTHATRKEVSGGFIFSLAGITDKSVNGGKQKARSIERAS